ncbi:Chloride channel, voltage gated [Carpediemonas membranifera]|uniref:Chloride channel protein n=1 Tax=Carpediemonas membranifera TaxID=201153 RepID=A0A8J6E4Y4_9EUKA|nr:Chloride channel, voltage gated [Carpediemonas membranifera]|eukprot:KAG9397511.1 Chloride channel, voltage gated [Carpediemonas membranifera]
MQGIDGDSLAQLGKNAWEYSMAFISHVKYVTLDETELDILKNSSKPIVEKHYPSLVSWRFFLPLMLHKIISALKHFFLDVFVAVTVAVLAIALSIAVDLLTTLHHNISFQLTYVQSGKISTLFSLIAYINYGMLLSFFAGVLVQLFGKTTIGNCGFVRLKAHMAGFRHLAFVPRMFSIPRSTARLIACALSVGAGVSVDKESVIVITGVAVMYNVGRIPLLRRAVDWEICSAIGLVSGFTAAFGSPITALLVCLEDMPRTMKSAKAITRSIPVAVWTVACVYLLNTHIRSNLSDSIFRGSQSAAMPVLSAVAEHYNVRILLTLPLLGVVLGLVGLTMTCTMRLAASLRRFAMERSSAWFTLTIIGGICSIAYFTPTLMGRADWHLISSLYEAGVVHEADELSAKELVGILIFKALFTCVSYGAPSAGGLLVPVAAVGGVVGSLFAGVLSILPFSWGTIVYFPKSGGANYSAPAMIQRGFFAMAGSAGLLAASFLSPYTSATLICEMTQSISMLPALLLTTAVAHWTMSVFGKPIQDRLDYVIDEVPVAVSEPPVIAQELTVAAVMSGPVNMAPRSVTAASIPEFLYGNYFSFFPVEGDLKNVPIAMIRRDSLVELEKTLTAEDGEEADITIACPTEPLVIVPASTPLSVAYDMIDRGVSTLCVCDPLDGMKCVGIVTRRDLTATLTLEPEQESEPEDMVEVDRCEVPDTPVAQHADSTASLDVLGDSMRSNAGTGSRRSQRAHGRGNVGYSRLVDMLDMYQGADF